MVIYGRFYEFTWAEKHSLKLRKNHFPWENEVGSVNDSWLKVLECCDLLPWSHPWIVCVLPFSGILRDETLFLYFVFGSEFADSWTYSAHPLTFYKYIRKKWFRWRCNRLNIPSNSQSEAHVANGGNEKCDGMCSRALFFIYWKSCRRTLPCLSPSAGDVYLPVCPFPFLVALLYERGKNESHGNADSFPLNLFTCFKSVQYG